MIALHDGNFSHSALHASADLHDGCFLRRATMFGPGDRPALSAVQHSFSCGATGTVCTFLAAAGVVAGEPSLSFRFSHGVHTVH